MKQDQLAKEISLFSMIRSQAQLSIPEEKRYKPVKVGIYHPRNLNPEKFTYNKK